MKQEPAFPQDYSLHTGMTLRDYFAAKAMQGMMASGNLPKSVSDKELSHVSYQLADAMMEARK